MHIKTQTTRLHALKRALVLALLVVLPACTADDNRAHDYRIGHPLKVTPDTITIALEVTSETAAINSFDETRLHRFARDYINRGRSLLTVAVSPTTLKTGERLRSLFISWGVLDSAINVEPSLEQGSLVEMRFSGFKATVPECSDWSSGASFNWTNKSHSNFGCSTQRNLGLMVTDPGDLKNAQPMTNRSAQPAVEATHTPYMDTQRPTASTSVTQGGAGSADTTTDATTQ